MEAMNRLHGFLRRQIYRLLPTQDIFRSIYRTNAWGDKDSVSGPGSNPELTAAIRMALPNILRDLQVHTLLDAPCGDFGWMNGLDLPIDRYIGLDIVPELVARNQSAYGSEARAFRIANIAKDPLPQADAILCRDALVHLSTPLAQEAIHNFRRSGATWLLATTFPATMENRDIPTGEWRPLNLERPPFSFPKPFRLVDEKCISFQGGRWKDKALGVWRVADLPA
jgi:hypothetical protein